MATIYLNFLLNSRKILWLFRKQTSTSKSIQFLSGSTSPYLPFNKIDQDTNLYLKFLELPLFWIYSPAILNSGKTWYLLSTNFLLIPLCYLILSTQTEFRNNLLLKVRIKILIKSLIFSFWFSYAPSCSFS